MTSFAVIQTGGKQYLVEPGKRYRFEKLPGNEGDAIAFDRVLLTFGSDGSDVRVGTPTVASTVVAGKIFRQGRARKIEVIKYKAKSRYRRKYGHRQHFTEVEVIGIQG
ncbi:MAG: 50S ribosomal protein L21 [bacterium]|nr:50S ribosomal protein L21 [bacterium]